VPSPRSCGSAGGSEWRSFPSSSVGFRAVSSSCSDIGVTRRFLPATDGHRRHRDIYEIVVERHRNAATVVTSNREPVPVEWLALMADGLLAQSAIDRLLSVAYELVLDGASYRPRQRPTPGVSSELPSRRQRRAWPTCLRPVIIATSTLEASRTRSHAPGGEMVPSRWRATSGRPCPGALHSLEPRHAAPVAVKRLRILDKLASREHGEAGHPKVDTDDGSCMASGRVSPLDLATERDEPPSASSEMVAERIRARPLSRSSRSFVAARSCGRPQYAGAGGGGRPARGSRRW